MNKMNTILPRSLLANYRTVKSFTFWKVSVKPYSFRVPVYKGVVLTWMESQPSFDENCYQIIVLWKASLAQKWVLKHKNLGFPFIKGLSPHEFNENHPLTMTPGQLYEWKKFRFLKSEC